MFTQLKRYSFNLKKRIKNAKIYELYLKNCKNIKFSKFSKNNSYFIFQIFVNENIRNSLIQEMVKNNIGCSIHYATPLPYFDYYKKFNSKKFRNSEKYAKMNISLPVHPELKRADIKFITNFLKKNT